MNAVEPVAEPEDEQTPCERAAEAIDLPRGWAVRPDPLIVLCECPGDRTRDGEPITVVAYSVGTGDDMTWRVDPTPLEAHWKLWCPDRETAIDVLERVVRNAEARRLVMLDPEYSDRERAQWSYALEEHLNAIDAGIEQVVIE